MKKLFYSMLAIACIFVFAGCENKESKNEKQEMTCTVTKNDSTNGYQLDTIYKVSAENGIVKTIKTEEIVTSDSKEFLDAFEKQLEQVYSTMNNTYSGYDYTIDNDGYSVVGKMSIDYSKVDLEKLAKNDANMKKIMNSKNQVILSKAKSLYESLGATCK